MVSNLADSTPAIELRHTTKRYGETVALNDVSMVIEPGEFFCLLGPSGCGKTTTLNLIGGVLPLPPGGPLIEGRRGNHPPPPQRHPETGLPKHPPFPPQTVGPQVSVRVGP